MFPEQPLLSLNDPSHLVLQCKAIQGNIGLHHRIHTLAASSVLAHNHRHPRIVAQIKPRTVRIPTMMLPELYHPSHIVTTRTHREVVIGIVICLSSLRLDPMMAMGALKEAVVAVVELARLGIQGLWAFTLDMETSSLKLP
jgi:hypothetical protein